MRRIAGVTVAGVAVALAAGCGGSGGSASAPAQSGAARSAVLAADPCAPGSPLRRELDRGAEAARRHAAQAVARGGFAGRPNAGCASLRIR